jgi:hypothetical protein
MFRSTLTNIAIWQPVHAFGRHPGCPGAAPAVRVLKLSGSCAMRRLVRRHAG